MAGQYYTQDWLELMHMVPDPGATATAPTQQQRIQQAAMDEIEAPGGTDAASTTMALSAHPAVAIAMAAMSAAGGVNDLIQGKKTYRREKRRIKTEFQSRRGRARLDIVDSGEGVARRMGSDVAAQMAASGMVASGPAMNAVMNNRMQVLANIPGQLAGAMSTINDQEDRARAEAEAAYDAMWNKGMSGIAAMAPILGKIQIPRK